MKIETEATLNSKFLENMHEAVLILDENYKIVDCNFTARHWYGYSKEEIAKLNLADIRAPQERSKIANQMSTVWNQEGAMWQTIHQRKDGSTFHVEVSSTPITIGSTKRFYHVVRDVDDRVKKDLLLRESEERYRRIVDLSPETIFIHRDGQVIFMNKSGLKLFGAATPDEIIGKSLWALYPPERHGIVRARNQTMEQTKESAPMVEHTMLRLDGFKLNVEALATIIDYENKPAFYVVLRDITERKKINMYLDLQYAASRDLVHATSLSEGATNVLRTICTNLKLDHGIIWSIDKKEDTLRCVASFNNNAQEMNTSITHRSISPVDATGMLKQVLTSDECCWISDIPKTFPNEYPTDSGYKLGIAVPIHSDKDLVGALEFFNTNDLPKDEGVLEALQGIGYQLGSFLRRKNFEKEIRYISKHDATTGLPNRAMFEETLGYELTLAQNKDQRLAVLFIEINHFNIINEALGHAAGDDLLRLVRERLFELGISDDRIARFSTDEFALIINNYDLISQVTDYVNKINSALATPFVIQEQRISVTINIGVSFFPEDSDEVQTLLKCASIALTAAREMGAGSFAFCNPEMAAKANKRISLENDLRTAIAKHEFALHYQPIVETPVMLIKGMESLIRWEHDGKFISPAEFIPLAEKTHLIIPIGEWILRTACLQCKAWNEKLEDKKFVSVNISPIQFKNTDVVAVIAQVLRDTGLEPECLKIEVTETAVMDNAQRSINTLRKIKDLGVRISIDDFGTGYSSLNYLRRLPIDYLKIDQSFIREMTTNSNDAAIVKTIIELAKNLGYKVIAEGVETQEQVNFLSTLGCFEIQGYYFSRPMPADDAIEFMRQGKLSS